MGFFTRNQKGDDEGTPGSRQSGRAGASAGNTRRSGGAAAREDVEADELRRRARRRLVGAIAMVLLAVIVLPIVLDDERGSVPESISMDMPADGQTSQPGLAVVTPPPGFGDPIGSAGRVGQEAPTSLEPNVRLPASIATITPVPGQASLPPTPEPATTPEAATPPPATPAQPRATPEPPPEPPPTTQRPSPPPNAAATRKEAEAARALALLEGKPAPAPAAASQAAPSRFAVQVVAVRSRQGADDLLGRLRGAGLTAYIESITTPDGQVHRVRLGPFNSRSQAESAQAKLRSLPGGYSGSLVPL